MGEPLRLLRACRVIPVLLAIGMVAGAMTGARAALLGVSPTPTATSVIEGVGSGTGFIKFTVNNLAGAPVFILGVNPGAIRNTGPDPGDLIVSTNVFADTCSVTTLPIGGVCGFDLGFITPPRDVLEPIDFGDNFIFATVIYRDPFLARFAIASGFAEVVVKDVPEPAIGLALLLVGLPAMRALRPNLSGGVTLPGR